MAKEQIKLHSIKTGGVKKAEQSAKAMAKAKEAHGAAYTGKVPKDQKAKVDARKAEMEEKYKAQQKTSKFLLGEDIPKERAKRFVLRDEQYVSQKKLSRAMGSKEHVHKSLTGAYGKQVRQQNRISKDKAKDGRFVYSASKPKKK